eukprot:122725-Amphidinium_carterae.1
MIKGLGKDKVATPLDLKFFDSLRSNEVVAAGIRRLFEINGPEKATEESIMLEAHKVELLQWILNIGFIVGGGKSRKYKRKVLRRKRGVASRWPCTASLDTLLSYALVLGVCPELGIDLSTPDIRTQGDELELLWRDKQSAENFVRCMASLGVVHPSKGWVSTSRSEFWRTMRGEYGTMSYPVRPLAIILSPQP